MGRRQPDGGAQSVRRGVAEPIVDAYEHDAMDQLICARYQVVNGVQAREMQHQYDLVGSRPVVTEDGASVQSTENNLNQYLTVGGESLRWDANGNQVSAPALVLQHDAWNRLIGAARETKLVPFAYDGRHRCVKRTEIDGATAQTVVIIWGYELSQGWERLEERGANGELLARHVHGPSVVDLVLSERGGVVY